MSTPRFTLYPPRPNMCGNLIWELPVCAEEALELCALFERIRATGIWCSCFPAGDGFCFAPDKEGRLDETELTPEYYTQLTTLFKEVFGGDLFVQTFNHN